MLFMAKANLNSLRYLTHKKVKEAGENIFFFLYGAKDGKHTVDALRYILLQKYL